MDNNVGWVENKPLSEQQQLKEARQKKSMCGGDWGGELQRGLREIHARYITIKYGKGSHCGEQCYHNI